MRRSHRGRRRRRAACLELGGFVLEVVQALIALGSGKDVVEPVRRVDRAVAGAAFADALRVDKKHLTFYCLSNFGVAFDHIGDRVTVTFNIIMQLL